MDRFFAKPTPQKIVEYIYAQILFVHETGGKTYRYLIPPELSISFINDVIDKLCDYIHDADIIELNHGYIVIDWS
jgi:hypothetical protein